MPKDVSAWWIPLLTIMIFKGITAITPTTKNRCEVYHYLNNEESMRCPFSENGRVEIGVMKLLEIGDKALSGVILRVYGPDLVELLSAEVPQFDSKNLECRMDKTKSKMKIDMTTPFKWDNMELLFTENRTLIIPERGDDGHNVSVCSNRMVDKRPAFLTLTSNLTGVENSSFGLHMLCNCFSGTPVFPHDTLAKYYNHWKGEKFYIRAVRHDAKAILQLKQFISPEGKSAVPPTLKVNISVANIGKKIGIWEPVILRTDSVKTQNGFDDVVVFVIGDLVRVLRKNESTKRLGLVIYESSGFEWTVDKPPGNHISRIPSSHIPTITVTTPTIPEGAARATVQSSKEGSTRWDIVFVTFLVVWLAFLALLALLRRGRLRESLQSGGGAAPGVNSTMRPNSRPSFPLPRDANGNETSAASRELLDSRSSASASVELNATHYRPRNSLSMAQQASPRLQVPVRPPCPLPESVNAASDGVDDDEYDYVDLNAILSDPEQGKTTRPKRGAKLDDIKRFIPCFN